MAPLLLAESVSPTFQSTCVGGQSQVLELLFLQTPDPAGPGGEVCLPECWNKGQRHMLIFFSAQVEPEGCGLWALGQWWPFFHHKGVSTDGVSAKNIRAEGKQVENPSVAVKPLIKSPWRVSCVCS